MIDKQPEALRLADALEAYDICASVEAMPDLDVVAAELRRLYEVNERLKTVPMKYRRMEFNAQLQEENSRLHALNAELLEALRWIDRRCDKNYFTDKHPLHQIHWEMAHDAGACAQAAIAKAIREKP